MIYNVANQKNAFSKAEKERLNQNIEELKSKDETLDNEIETLKNNKANQSELENLSNRVSGTEQNVIGLNNNKADRAELNDKITQTQLTNALNSKANKWDSINGFNAGSSYQLMDVNGKIPNERLNISDNAQIGDIRMTQADAIYKPDGSVDNTWLSCNGDIVNEELYPEYAKIASYGLVDYTQEEIKPSVNKAFYNYPNQNVWAELDITNGEINFTKDFITYQSVDLSSIKTKLPNSSSNTDYDTQARLLCNDTTWFLIVYDGYTQNQNKYLVYRTTDLAMEFSSWTMNSIIIRSVVGRPASKFCVSDDDIMYVASIWDNFYIQAINLNETETQPNQSIIIKTDDELDNFYRTNLYKCNSFNSYCYCVLIADDKEYFTEAKFNLETAQLEHVTIDSSFLGIKYFTKDSNYNGGWLCTQQFSLNYINNQYIIQKSNNKYDTKVESVTTSQNNFYYKLIPGTWETIIYNTDRLLDPDTKNWKDKTMSYIFEENNSYIYNYINNYGHVWVSNSPRFSNKQAELNIIGYIYNNNKMTPIYSHHFNEDFILPNNETIEWTNSYNGSRTHTFLINEAQGAIQKRKSNGYDIIDVISAYGAEPFTIKKITPYISLSHISSGFADIKTFQKISQ